MRKVSHFRFALRFLFIITGFFCICNGVAAQTLGGAAAYTFLKFPFSTLQTATGGSNISLATNDVSFSLQNPALLQPTHNSQASFQFTHLPAGIQGYQLAGAHHASSWDATLGGWITFVNYGSLQQTDAAGNVFGQFRAADIMVQASIAKAYLQKWHYGFTAKWIQSYYGAYSSHALALDAGLIYADTATGLQLGFTAKNMGVQLKNYINEKEDLPLDLQIGVTKKLQKAPLAFSLTAYSLHRFNLSYNDTLFNRLNNFDNSSGWAKNLFNHFVIASHLYLSKQLEIHAGYNFLRRAELSLGSEGNGLAGFSAGFAARFEKMHVSFARSAYAKGNAYNQIGINLQIGKMLGSGLF